MKCTVNAHLNVILLRLFQSYQSEVRIDNYRFYDGTAEQISDGASPRPIFSSRRPLQGCTLPFQNLLSIIRNSSEASGTIIY